MSIILNGTTGITTPDVTSDGLTVDSTTLVVDETNNRVGIGTSSPNARLEALSSTAGAEISRFEGSYSASGTVNLTNWRRSGGAVASVMRYNDANTDMEFGTTTSHSQAFITGGTERARIDSSGNLLVGTTSQGGSSTVSIVRPANTATYIYMLKNTQLEMTMGAKASTDTNFYIGTGSSTIGTNGVYMTNTGNSWNAISDERKKNIIEPIENGLEKVNSLRAVIGSYKHDPQSIRRPFLIAQDVQEVLPEAVNVQDEEDGTLGMSYTDTIPLLVAAIKELKAISDAQAQTIESLTARVVALEGQP